LIGSTTEEATVASSSKSSAKMTVHYSSQTPIWETPDDFFKKYDDVYHFDCDVCALSTNTKVKDNYYTPEVDGLKQDWKGVCWMNPPYGREIGEWVKKAYESSLKGTTVVCLLPSRTDTKWWHAYVMKGEYTFLPGRLKFSGHANAAPFPNVIVVFNGVKNGS
jgi:phage N-6-adenine-methyltransferase